MEFVLFLINVNTLEFFVMIPILTILCRLGLKNKVNLRFSIRY